MTHTVVEGIYAIRHKESGDFISCNGHNSWNKQGSAKVSWGIACSSWKDRKGAFDRQQDYEIVNILAELSSTQQKLEEFQIENSGLLTALGW